MDKTRLGPAVYLFNKVISHILTMFCFAVKHTKSKLLRDFRIVPCPVTVAQLVGLMLN